MRKNYLWFDLGYTLMKQKREILYQRFLREKSIYIPFHEIEKTYHLADKYFMREFPGVLNGDTHTFYPWYLGVLNNLLELRFDLFEQSQKILNWKEQIHYYWTPFYFTVPILKALKRESYKIGLISNWDFDARKLLEEHGLLPFFDTIVISSEVGIEKPDPQIFQYALKEAKVSAEESIYIGDNYYDDVVGSSKVGMESVLINRYGKKGIEELSHDSIILSIQELPKLLNEKINNDQYTIKLEA